MRIERTGCPVEPDLIAQIRRGNPAAFERVYERHYADIYTYLYYRLGDQTMAEDLTGEVFARLVERSASLEDQGRPVLAWLYTIARNLLVDHYRRNGRHVTLSLDEQRDSLVDDNDQGDPLEQAAMSIAQGVLAKAIEQLTEDQRQVILLKFFGDYSNAETGQITGNTEGGVKALQHRALAALRRIFEDQPNDKLL